MLALLFTLSPLASAAQSLPQQAPVADTQEDQGIFTLDERPSWRFGDVLRLDLTGKVDLELRSSPDVDVDRAEVERRRVGVDGRLFGVLGFQVERELADSDRPWRDVFVELRQWRALRVRAGRFKMPFGQERLTSIADLEFANRSIPTEALTPARDTGVEVNGRLFGRTIDYSAGVFRQSGDEWRGDDEPGGRTVAGRLVLAPLRAVPLRALQRLEVGLAATHGDVPEGRHGLRARTANGYEAFAPVYVFGTRRGLGIDAALVHGPVSARAELLQVRDERRRQGLGDEDLPDVTARGWYLSAASFVVGGLRPGGTAPRSPVGSGGIGAIQVAGRIESLAFGSGGPLGDALRNPRAAAVLPNDLTGLTLGLNWYPVRYVKVQLNVIRERLQDSERRPDPARPWISSGVLRLQLAM